MRVRALTMLTSICWTFLVFPSKLIEVSPLALLAILLSNTKPLSINPWLASSPHILKYFNSSSVTSSLPLLLISQLHHILWLLSYGLCHYWLVTTTLFQYFLPLPRDYVSSMLSSPSDFCPRHTLCSPPLNIEIYISMVSDLKGKIYLSTKNILSQVGTSFVVQTRQILLGETHDYLVTI